MTGEISCLHTHCHRNERIFYSLWSQATELGKRRADDFLCLPYAIVQSRQVVSGLILCQYVQLNFIGSV